MKYEPADNPSDRYFNPNLELYTPVKKGVRKNITRRNSKSLKQNYSGPLLHSSTLQLNTITKSASQLPICKVTVFKRTLAKSNLSTKNKSLWK